MVMLELAVATVPIAALLILSEIMWRARIIRGEAARKFLHIIIGSYVAYWLYFLTFEQIELLAVAMLVGVSISHKYHIFHAITDIKRKTWGDIFYAAGLGLIAFITRQPWVFALAVLHMSVADGLAGLVGTQFGRGNTYTVFGAVKSVVGTVTFALASLGLLLAFRVSHPEITLPIVFGLPLILAAVENFGIYGTDNLAIPVLVALIANALL